MNDPVARFNRWVVSRPIPAWCGEKNGRDTCNWPAGKKHRWHVPANHALRFWRYWRVR